MGLEQYPWISQLKKLLDERTSNLFCHLLSSMEYSQPKWPLHTISVKSPAFLRAIALDVG